MLTYFLPGYNNYKIRTNQIPSGSTFLRVCTQNMLTLEDYCFLLNPGQWSYDSCESTVDISFNLDIALDVNVGDEYRLYLTPAITNSVTPFTYLDDIWHGSLQVFYSQSVNKPAYVNQIPLEDVFISEDTANTFVYWSQTQPPGPTTTTTTGAPTTTTTAAPTTTTTSTTSTTTTTTSTTTTSTTTTTTTAAPVTLNSELFIGNLLGVSGNNVCISGSTDGVIDSTIIYELKTFLSSDAGCTTPYGTSWDLLNLPNIYNYNGQVQRSTTSGGQIDNANYYRNRVSGSFAFQYQPGNLMSPTFTFDISGSGYQDFTHAGLTYRINAAGCKLNNSVDCTEALEIEYLVVAGGGGGGTANGGVNGAGGGAGGWQTGSAIIADNSAMTVTVGTGGAGAIYFTTEAQNGTNSSFNSLTSTGGGKGGSGNGLGTGAGGNPVFNIGWFIGCCMIGMLMARLLAFAFAFAFAFFLIIPIPVILTLSIKSCCFDRNI